MSSLSFTKARPVNVGFTSTRKYDLPFDMELGFNAIVGSWDKNLETNLYSINPVAVLDKLEKDELVDLASLTLGCQIRKDTACVWDVVFNALRRDHLVSCVFVADENYEPLKGNRVLTHSQFLDQERHISRLQENMVDKGSRIGVSIYNENNQKTFVLLYTVVGHCLAYHIQLKPDDRKVKTSALNCTLDHVYVIEADDSASRLDVDEAITPNNNAHTFVEWMVNCVNDTRTVFPWKPHFLPATHRAYNSEQILKTRDAAIENAVETTYDEFEDIVRIVYNKIRLKRIGALSRTRSNAKDTAVDNKTTRVQNTFEVPEIEVIDLGDTNRLYVRIIDHNNNRGYIFDKPTDKKTTLVERFLLNKDLENKILTEVTGIFVMSDVSGEKPYILRTLTANF
jgi:hypothetical protein